MRNDLVILGDYDPDSETHRATDRAIGHSLGALNAQLVVGWISTAAIKDLDIREAHGLWVAPGSPYRDFLRTIAAIRTARENLVPCLGTCGGFQHIVLEFARDILGFEDAHHAEYDTKTSALFISALSCPAAGKELRVKLQPQTMAYHLYGKDEAVERYYCTFGINPEYSEILSAHRDLVVSGRDLNGEIRIIELLNHPFFLGTLFVPQAQSREYLPHPLVNGFVQAALQHRAAAKSGA